MLPRVVLHKRNGHSHPPAKPEVTPSHVMLLVHSPRTADDSLPRDLLRFAALVRSEKPSALVEQASYQIDGLRLSISEVLARTQAAFDRGEMADIREALESARAQVDAAAALVRALLGSLPTDDAARVAVDLPDLLVQTVETLRPRLEGGLALVTRVEPGGPRLLGSPPQL